MTTPHVGIVLQARRASTRLPGKALLTIAGRTMLEHCVRRLGRGGVGRVILATTDSPDDDELVSVAARLDALVFRGHRHDVLDRFLGAAETFQLDVVVRATADNPAVDHDAPARVVATLLASGADYVCEAGLPYGGGVEAVTVAALSRAYAMTPTAYEREHVTAAVRNRPDAFRTVEVPAPPHLTCPSLRVTVDTIDDLARLRELYARVGTDDPSLAALVALAELSGREAA